MEMLGQLYSRSYYEFHSTFLKRVNVMETHHRKQTEQALFRNLINTSPVHEIYLQFFHLKSWSGKST